MSAYEHPKFPKPGEEGHLELSWTVCFERTCQVHMSEKQGAGWFPTVAGWHEARERLEEERAQSQRARERPVRVFGGPRHRQGRGCRQSPESTSESEQSEDWSKSWENCQTNQEVSVDSDAQEWQKKEVKVDKPESFW